MLHHSEGWPREPAIPLAARSRSSVASYAAAAFGNRQGCQNDRNGGSCHSIPHIMRISARLPYRQEFSFRIAHGDDLIGAGERTRCAGGCVR